MNVPLIFIFLTISGLIALGVMVYIITRFKNQLKNGELSPGLLSHYITKKNSKGDDIYYPVVEFKTLSGQTIKEHSIYGTAKDKFVENSTVNVIYQPNEPSKFFIEGQNPTIAAYITIISICLTQIIMTFYLYRIDPNFLDKMVSFIK